MAHLPRFDSVDSCRRAAARLLREGINGQRDSLETHRLINCANLIARMITGISVEERVEELESRVTQQDSLMKVIQRRGL